MQLLKQLQNLGIDKGKLAPEIEAKVRLTNTFLLIMLSAVPSYFALFFFLGISSRSWGFFFPLIIYPIGLLGAKKKNFSLARHCLMLGFISGIFFFNLLLGQGVAVELFYFVVIGLSYLIHPKGDTAFSYLYTAICLVLMGLGYLNWSPFTMELDADLKFWLTFSMYPVTLILVSVMIKFFNDSIQSHLKIEKQQRKKLEVLNEELNQFAYVVAHDLKAPLQTIYSMVNLVEDYHKNELSDEVGKIFGIMGERARLMDQLITDILDYTNAVKEDKKVSSFTSQDILKNVVSLLVVPKNIQIKKPIENIGIQGSYIQLQQVLSNLIGNAIKYHNPDGGWISISISPPKEDFLQFEVIDNGPGIRKEDQKKVFQFLENLGSEKDSSTGIGLSIVKKLVENNGGKLGLRSELGNGCNFWFTWPVKPLQLA